MPYPQSQYYYQNQAMHSHQGISQYPHVRQRVMWNGSEEATELECQRCLSVQLTFVMLSGNTSFQAGAEITVYSNIKKLGEICGH